MRIIEATKLRAKTVALQTCDTILKYTHRSALRRLHEVLRNPDPNPAIMHQQIAHQTALVARAYQLRKQCADLIVSHRFDVVMFNEGIPDRAEPDRAD